MNRAPLPPPFQAKAFLGALKPAYWQALAVVCVIYFSRFDWSFVILRAKQVTAAPELLQSWPGLSPVRMCFTFMNVPLIPGAGH